MIGMGEEEEKQRYFSTRFGSFGSSSSSSSKKLKPKIRRVPQRGLGVAQLEKIRLEEQLRHDAAAAANFSSPPKSSYFSFPVPGFRQMNRPSSSFPSQPSMNVSSPSSSSMFRPPLPVFNLAVKDSFTVPLVDQANSGGFDTVEKENYRVDPGLAFRSNYGFPHEISPAAWPSPELLQRAQQNHSPSPPMVNVSSTTSMPSGLNVQLEPPSNQSYCYANYSTIWADKEEKMVGMKRPSLFNPNNPTELKFDYNHSAFGAPNRFDDSTLQGSGSVPRFREVRTPSLGISAPRSLENKKEDDCNGNFLSLAPRSTCWTSCPSSNNAKRPPTYPQQNRKHLATEHRPVQGGTKPGRSTRRQTFYSFLPPAGVIASTQTVYESIFKGGVGERVDLDLKL